MHLFFRKPQVLAGAVFFFFFSMSQAQAGDGLFSAIEDSKFIGFAKAMYIGDDKKGGRPNQNTLGIGGKVGVETGDYYGFSLKGAIFTTQDFGLRSDDPRKVDAYMFDLDKKPYSLLGEMQLSAKLGNTSLLIGRQEFLSPIINTYDYRIIPNLFEAYTLTNRDIPETTVTLAYMSKMSGLDTVTAYGNWGGYPEFVLMPYMHAENKGSSAIVGSNLSRMTILFDLGAYGLTGHSLLLGHANINIDEKVLANSDVKVSALLYRVDADRKLTHERGKC